MKKTALVVLALAAATAFAACGKKTPPAAPPPPPVVPEAPPPAPPPPPRAEAPVVDEYARLKAMSAEEIEKTGLLAEVYFDFTSQIRIRTAPRCRSCRRLAVRSSTVEALHKAGQSETTLGERRAVRPQAGAGVPAARPNSRQGPSRSRKDAGSETAAPTSRPGDAWTDAMN
jgi:hypothetical protein